MRSPESTVLVTGGGGRLGRLVVAALRASGTKTLALSRRAGGGDSDDLVADLADRNATMSLLGGRTIDAIVHLAAVMHPDDDLDISARMDATLDAIMRETSPRAVVFTSTGAVYGDKIARALSEDASTPGSSEYALSKLATERMLRSATAEIPGLTSTTLRVFNIAGPSFPESLVPRLLAADGEHPVQLVSPDLFVRDYIHQSDVVRVILAALTRCEPGYRVVNVGAGVPVSTRTMLSSLSVETDAWVEAPGRESSNWSNNSLMRRSFGVMPHSVPTRAWAQADLEHERQKPIGYARGD